MDKDVMFQNNVFKRTAFDLFLSASQYISYTHKSLVIIVGITLFYITRKKTRAGFLSKASEGCNIPSGTSKKS